MNEQRIGCIRFWWRAVLLNITMWNWELKKKAIQCAHTKHTIQVYKNVYQQPDDNDGSFRYYVVFSSRSLSFAQFGSVSPVDQHMRAIRKDVAPGASPNPNISFVILCVYIFLPFLPFLRATIKQQSKKMCARCTFFSLSSLHRLSTFVHGFFPFPICVLFWALASNLIIKWCMLEREFPAHTERWTTTTSSTKSLRLTIKFSFAKRPNWIRNEMILTSHSRSSGSMYGAPFNCLFSETIKVDIAKVVRCKMLPMNKKTEKTTEKCPVTVWRQF